MKWSSSNFTHSHGVTAPYADNPPFSPDHHHHHHHLNPDQLNRFHLHLNDSSQQATPYYNNGNDDYYDYNNQLTPQLMYWYYTNGLAGTAIAIFGLLGNTVSIVILTQRTMRNSTSILLIFMGIFDNLFLLLNLLVQTFPVIFLTHDICPEYIHVRNFLFKHFYAVVHMAHTGTIYMTMLVTVERAMVVMRPLRAKYICTRRRAVLVSSAVLLWAVVYNIPRCLEFGTPHTAETVDEESNTTITEILVAKTDFAKSTFYNLYYLVYFNSLFHFIFPFLVICVLNAMIIARLFHRRRNVPRNQRRGVQVESESKLTIMVLSLTVVFSICHVFAAVELIVVQMEKNYTHQLGHCSPACEGLSAFAETMTIVNSATNFLLYSIFGERFRRACIRYVCPFVKQHKSNGVTLQRTSHSVLTSSYRGETFQLRHTDSMDS